MTVSTWQASRPKEHSTQFSPSEPSFYSDVSGIAYKASQLKELSDAIIESLIAETSEIIISVRTTKEDAEYRISLGEEVDLAWLKRVRYKLNKLGNFRRILNEELCGRKGVDGHIASIRSAKKEATRAIRREKRRMESHIAHQQALKDHSFQVRKAFYELVKEHIGVAAFDRLVAKSKEIAEDIAPHP